MFCTLFVTSVTFTLLCDLKNSTQIFRYYLTRKATVRTIIYVYQGQVRQQSL